MKHLLPPSWRPTARRPRPGPNLVLYRGTPSEVLERVGKDNRFYAKLALAIAIAGLILLVLPFSGVL